MLSVKEFYHDIIHVHMYAIRIFFIFAILRFNRIKLWYLFKHFDKLLHDFDVGLNFRIIFGML